MPTRRTQAGPARGGPRWKAHFLDKLARSSNVSEAAREAGVDPGQAYRLRREDPVFARQWLAALWEGYLLLEFEVLRRLREGDLRAAKDERFDFANAIRLLSSHRDSAIQAQAQERNVSAAEVRASIDRKVEEIQRKVQLAKEGEAGPQ